VAKRTFLSRGEIDVVQAVWDLKQATVGQVYEHLAQNKTIDYATVQTYLRRIEQKGYIRARRVGRNKLYLPKIPRRRVVGQLIQDLLNQVFDGQPLALMQHLIHEGRITPAEIAGLRLSLDRWAEERRKQQKGDGHERQ
jgi:BlaI family transcriptional regulator, penicillinase repressor